MIISEHINLTGSGKNAFLVGTAFYCLFFQTFLCITLVPLSTLYFFLFQMNKRCKSYRKIERFPLLVLKASVSQVQVAPRK